MPLSIAGALGGLLYVSVIVAFGFSPQATDVGYAPEQPVPYSHAVHVGQLGVDCRYCHNTVEETAHAAIPPTQTCMNCHAKIRSQSPKLIPVHASESIAASRKKRPGQRNWNRNSVRPELC